MLRSLQCAHIRVLTISLWADDKNNGCFLHISPCEREGDRSCHGTFCSGFFPVFSVILSTFAVAELTSLFFTCNNKI